MNRGIVVHGIASVDAAVSACETALPDTDLDFDVVHGFDYACGDIFFLLSETLIRELDYVLVVLAYTDAETDIADQLYMYLKSHECTKHMYIASVEVKPPSEEGKNDGLKPDQKWPQLDLVAKQAKQYSKN